ncbi:hypothetical protein CPC735_021670 [Coccidioides posadasii C735 delta SOWgp]|uniref:Uncharacterized protein n=1 Tax=Coccidioides posadasii (strain C735) TaxID=222929 RepID=C5PJG9_COCP7|nr:hypothetical protein CPC735_021670 [Coccidioides posadasii C735 delta SOWgp]EER22868.1 hypothetical protein CPC735_021670 [Coccidioides posadasii C735 delta SOWgp]|eukprot:XP_003065013.1 hypothetical protein CPC735_021670 [Coccidioides posadasii C735 delta SOWgp]
MTPLESPMAGDFFLDSPVPPKLDLTGARSQFYRSPRTPSATSSLSRSVTSSGHPNSRKRARYGYNDFDSHHTSSSLAWGGDLSTQFTDPTSPAPLANTDYRLAGGGLEAHKVPLASAGTALELEDNGAELDYRPSRYSTYPLTTGEGNKRKRERPTSAGNDTEEIDDSSVSTSFGWGRAVMNLVGGVAGKVWDFCWSGAFRGFYAGGGRGYDMNAPAVTAEVTPSLDQSAWEKLNQLESPLTPKPLISNDPASIDRPQPDSDWVLVKTEKRFGETTPSSLPRRVNRRGSLTHHGGLRRQGAKSTPKKPSLIPVRPSSSLAQKYQSSSTFSPSSPAPSNPSRTPNESPLALEAQRYAAKIRRREKEEDASIRRLNQQLKAMIREGKEALGTKIEIDETMDVDDYE